MSYLIYDYNHSLVLALTKAMSYFIYLLYISVLRFSFQVTPCYRTWCLFSGFSIGHIIAFNKDRSFPLDLQRVQSHTKTHLRLNITLLLEKDETDTPKKWCFGNDESTLPFCWLFIEDSKEKRIHWLIVNSKGLQTKVRNMMKQFSRNNLE